MAQRQMSDLFDPQMERWGYRADPIVWKRMKYEFRGEPLPADQEIMERRVVSKFAEITGADMFSLVDEEAYIKLPEFSRGGLSSGLVSPHFWREVALPELVTRYRKFMIKD